MLIRQTDTETLRADLLLIGMAPSDVERAPDSVLRGYARVHARRMPKRYPPIVLRDEIGPIPDTRATALMLARELSEDSAMHGAPWVSFGDVGRQGDNSVIVDREATCYVHSTEPLPATFFAPDGSIQPSRDHYSATIPAYNVWWRALSAGLRADDFGRTWWVYDSRAEYIASLD